MGFSRALAPLFLISSCALTACGGSTPAPEPVLLSQFNANTDRFDVVSTIGRPEGTIQKNGRPCDIYQIYTSGLTSGGRAAMKAGEVLTSVATLGLAQMIWAPVKAGTRPQLYTVLFCYGRTDKLVDIYDTDPTNSHEQDHMILNKCLVPGFDGAIFSSEWKEALWARFTTGAPRRQRQSVERYSIVKRA